MLSGWGRGRRLSNVLPYATMAGENANLPGYANLGRLYAIGYLKGLLEADARA